MRNVEDIVGELSRCGVQLWLAGDRVRYRAPRDGLTPERLAELKAREAEIREFLARRSGESTAHRALIPRHAREGALPLAIAQEGLWALDQSIPGNSFSNIFSAFSLAGALDVPLLQRAFDEIVRRHEILRTTFVAVHGRGSQVVSGCRRPNVLIEDLRTLPAVERDVAYLRRIIREAQQPFDLAHGPLLRVLLFRIEDERHLMILTLHHIVGDAWSLQVLVLELAALYEAFAYGRQSRLPELSVQYADYVMWQHHMLLTGALESQLSYWRSQLGGGDFPSMALPTDYPRPASMTFETSSRIIQLPSRLSEALKTAGRDDGCTLFMTLVCALVIVLHTFAKREDVRLAVLSANRNAAQTEGMIGLFINTLLLRTDLSGDPTLRVVLQRVRDTVLGAYDNQDLPFEVIVRALERERHLERSSLCSVLLLFGNPTIPDVTMSGVTLQAVDVGKGLLEAGIDFNTVTTFDFIITLAEKPQGVSGSLTYKSALFAPATVGRLLEYFRETLEQLVSRPGQRLSELPPLSGE